MEKEIRKCGTVQFRTDEPTVESRHIEGYALTFNSLSENLGNFREQIIPEALTEDIINQSDIFALLDHNPERKLARSRYGKGSLSLSIDEKGLHYEFDAPQTDAGDEVLEAVKRGDITSSSFAFTVAEDEWKKLEDGSYIRTIKKFDKLFDVSPVWEPAYQSTSVKCSRFSEIIEEEKKENEKRMAEEVKRQAEELEAYFNNLEQEIKDI